MKRNILTVFIFLIITHSASGAGFQINVQGLRQIAMGGTGVSVPWDASIIFYNPGGLARLPGMQAYASVQFLNVNTKYVQTPTGGYSAKSKEAVFTPFNFYVGGSLRKVHNLGVGLGVYTPFGSGLTWDDKWEGRYVIQSISMQTIFFQPTVSYLFSPTVALGAGFIYATGNVKFKRAIPVQDSMGNDGYGTLKGGAHGIGFNVGLHLKLNPDLQVGIGYRSAVKMKVDDGDAEFVMASSIKPNFPNSKFKAEVPMPQVISVGVGYHPFTKFSVTAEANYVVWQTYDTLKFDFTNDTLADSKAPRSYKNTLALRLGMMYQLSSMVTIMAGGALDPTPVVDGLVSPDLPDADRWLITGGMTFRPIHNLTVMLAIEYGASKKRDSEYTPDKFNGKYQTKAVIPCIGLTYDF